MFVCFIDVWCYSGLFMVPLNLEYSFGWLIKGLSLSRRDTWPRVTNLAMNDPDNNEYRPLQNLLSALDDKGVLSVCGFYRYAYLTIDTFTVKTIVWFCTLYFKMYYHDIALLALNKMATLPLPIAYNLVFKVSPQTTKKKSV